VTLDGRGSSDPGGGSLAYVWSQLAGPPVGALSGAQPTFTAPNTVTALVFQLVGGQALRRLLRRPTLQRRRQGGAQARLARDRPVKKMIGGVTGWLDEGFTLVDGAQ